MLNVWTSPTANQTFYACNISLGIGSCLNAAASGVVNVWLIDVDKIPVRSSGVTTSVLKCTLTQHYCYRVLAKLLVVSQGILNLPRCAVSLLR